jgi:hypothetical protein
MKAPELFGVCIRVIGFLTMIYGLWEIWWGVETVIETVCPFLVGGEASGDPLFLYIASGLPSFVFGVVCFFFPNWIVQLTYRE